MLSLLREQSHAAGGRWNVSGSVVGALEPFLLSLSDDVVTVWDRRDGRRLHRATVGRHAFNMLPALKDVGAGGTGNSCMTFDLFLLSPYLYVFTCPLSSLAGSAPAAFVCTEPSVTCRRASICLDRARLCDGTVDCPEGDDEDDCVTCSTNGTDGQESGADGVCVGTSCRLWVHRRLPV